MPPFYFVVAPATRPLATAYLLATQRTTKARCEGLGVSDDAKLLLFHETARDRCHFLQKNGSPLAAWRLGARENVMGCDFYWKYLERVRGKCLFLQING